MDAFVARPLFRAVLHAGHSGTHASRLECSANEGGNHDKAAYRRACLHATGRLHQPL
jgi:hypothetical protein